MQESKGIDKGFWEGRWPLVAVFAFLSALYLLNRNPFVGFNDGLSFLYAAVTGFDFDTNATSHFLYNNLQHVLVKVFFFLPPVLVLSLFSILCSLLGLWMFSKIAGIFSKNQFAIAATTLMMGLSFTFWQQTEVIEVYAFNNLIFLSFVWLALRDIFELKGRKNALWLSLLLGIGLLTHIQHILSIPFFIAYLFWGNSLRLQRKMLLMLPWMALMSILFVLPLAFKTHSLSAVFVESQFQEDLFGTQPMVILKGIGLGIGMLLYNFLFGLVFILMSWRKIWQNQKAKALWLLALLLPYAGFAFKYSVNDNHVFFLCSYFIFLLPAVLVLEDVKANGKRWLIALGAVLVPILMYWAAANFATEIPRMAEYDQAKAYKGGVKHLLWPGKAAAPDPLALAIMLQSDSSEAAEKLKAEWNYNAAIGYLEWSGVLEPSAQPFIYFQF